MRTDAYDRFQELYRRWYRDAEAARNNAYSGCMSGCADDLKALLESIETVPASRFEDWPENLDREDLVRLTRGFAGECFKTEQILVGAFPDGFPVGDAEVVPTGQRIVLDESPSDLALMAVREIERLRADCAPAGRVVLDPLNDRDVAALTAALRRTACCPPDEEMVGEALGAMAPYPRIEKAGG